MALASSQKPDPQDAHSDAELRQFVGYRLKRSFNVMRADLLQILDEFGLRISTYSALVLIDANPGIRQSHLSQMLSMERPNMVLILDDLEERGWITRERLKTDRRAFALTVTLAGKRVCEKAKRKNLEAEQAQLASLTPEEKAALFSALGKLEAGAKQ